MNKIKFQPATLNSIDKCSSVLVQLMTSTRKFTYSYSICPIYVYLILYQRGTHRHRTLRSVNSRLHCGQRIADYERHNASAARRPTMHRPLL